MNINSLTIKAQEALQAAVSLAREQGNQAVEPLHLLNVLVREDDSLSVFLLGRVGVNVRGLRGEVERAVRGLPHVSGGGEQFFSQDTTKVIQRAVDFTKNFGDTFRSRIRFPLFTSTSRTDSIFFNSFICAVFPSVSRNASVKVTYGSECPSIVTSISPSEILYNR